MDIQNLPSQALFEFKTLGFAFFRTHTHTNTNKSPGILRQVVHGPSHMKANLIKGLLHQEYIFSPKEKVIIIFTQHLHINIKCV